MSTLEEVVTQLTSTELKKLQKIISTELLSRSQVETKKESYINCSKSSNTGNAKVICIGLNKTGTSSIKGAYKILGNGAVYNMNVYNIKHLTGLAINGNFEILMRIASRYQFLKDRPWNVGECYKALDKSFYGTKFILTVRDEEEWWNSVLNWLSTKKELHHPTEERRLKKIKLYQVHFSCKEFNKDCFIEHYRNYNKNVREYFVANNRDNLLEINVCKGEGWEKLCSFLGADVPVGTPFPHKNKQEYLVR